MDKMADSAQARFVARVVLPVLLSIVGVLGTIQLMAINKGLDAQSTTLDAQAAALVLKDKADAAKAELVTAAITAVGTDMKLLGAKVDYSVLGQLQTNSTRIQKLEDRAERDDRAKLDGLRK